MGLFEQILEEGRLSTISWAVIGGGKGRLIGGGEKVNVDGCQFVLLEQSIKTTA